MEPTARETNWEWLGKLGVVCFVGAVVGGGMQAAGVTFAPLNSFASQGLLAGFGVSLWVFYVVVLRRHRVFVVTTPSSSISVPKGTIENAWYETTHFGGERVEIVATEFALSSDGSNLVFKNRWGSPVKLLPRSLVHQVHVE